MELPTFMSISCRDGPNARKRALARRRRLMDELGPFGWVKFRPHRASEDLCGRVPITRLQAARGRAAPRAEEMAGDQLTRGMTRLCEADLATVDTLHSRHRQQPSGGSALGSWAHPRARLYAQLKERVREIEELKSTFD